MNANPIEYSSGYEAGYAVGFAMGKRSMPTDKELRGRLIACLVERKKLEEQLVEAQSEIRDLLRLGDES